MKLVFSVLMMILSLLIGFQQAIVVMHFKLNQELIEKEFCINKNKPELHCHGTCFLQKRIQRSEKSSTSSSISLFQKTDMLPISRIELKATNLVTVLHRPNAIYKEKHYIEPLIEKVVPPPIGYSNL